MDDLLKLADMAEYSHDEIKAHIAGGYAGKEAYDYGTDEDRESLRKELEAFELLVAYESVGSWGCDSASFFLLRKDGKLYENHASHCSCYGFEGQWEPEEVTKEALQKRSYFSMGGYDNDSEANTQAIKDYINAL